MYVDRPRPSPRVFILPGCLALFFAAMGSVIVVLTILALPPPVWVFIMPVILLCVAGVVTVGWYAVGLTQLEYCLGNGVLEIRRRGSRTVYRLRDVEDIASLDRTADAPPPAAAPDAPSRGGISSARRFANRSGGNLLLNVRGEWIRVSPTDPKLFLRVLEAERES